MKTVYVNVYPEGKNFVHRTRDEADTCAALDRDFLARVDIPAGTDTECVVAGRGKAGFLSWLNQVGGKQTGPQQSPLAEAIAEPMPSAPAEDTVAVGDLNSAARGTGARKNSGKPDWSQLPMWAVWPIAEAYVRGEGAAFATVALHHMAAWQRGDDAALDEAGAAILRMLAIEDKKAAGVLLPRGDTTPWPARSLIHVVRVLEFGAKKYAKGNWAKGMSWSVCYSCVVSHLTKALSGEERDEESGELHLAHALCNVVFLLGYRDLYPDGDDRLKEFQPGGVK